VTTRCPFKDKAYFDGWIAYRTGKLQEFRAIVVDPRTTAEHRNSLRHTIFRRTLELWIMRYSRGDSIAELREAFPAVIEGLVEYQMHAGHGTHDFRNFDAYIYALWIISLCILLGEEGPLLDRALRELNNLGRDAIFDRLAALRIRDVQPAAELLYPYPYDFLLKALDATDEAHTLEIKTFLANYYDGMQGAYWHGSHERDDTGFFGYWCFELAAFVKVLGIEDSDFADNPFYPRDLVCQLIT
jgi:hypothetical protein